MTREQIEQHAKTLAASWKVQLQGGEDLTVNLVSLTRSAYEYGVATGILEAKEARDFDEEQYRKSV